MSHITIEQLTSHITFEQEEPAVMIELDDEKIVSIVGGRGNNDGGSNNDVDGGNNVNVTVNVLNILSQNALGIGVGGLLGGLSSVLLRGSAHTQA